MKENFVKLFLASTLALSVIVPAMANTTEVNILATITEVVVLQVERTGGGNQIVSGDDTDPSPGSPALDAVIDFGTLNALGQQMVVGTTSTNGIANPTVTGMVIDTTNTLYAPATPLPAGSTRKGAIFYMAGALQLRQLRTGATATMDVDVYNDATSALSAIAEPAATTFAAGGFPASSIMVPGMANGRVPAVGGGLVTALARDTAYPISVGVYVPMTQVSGTNLKTTIVFTGT